MAKKDRPPKVAKRTPPPEAASLMRELVSRGYDSRTVFGEPIIHGAVIVVPAARVSAGAGGGFGSEPGTGTDTGAVARQSPGEGAGMGHGVHARPAGYIEITEAGTRWVPALDLGRLLTTAIVATALVMLALVLRRRRRR